MIISHQGLRQGRETIWDMDMRNQCKSNKILQVRKIVKKIVLLKGVLKVEVNKSITLSSQVITHIKTTTIIQAWVWRKEKTTWSFSIEMEFSNKLRHSSLSNHLKPKRSILVMYMELILSQLVKFLDKMQVHKRMPWIIWRSSTSSATKRFLKIFCKNQLNLIQKSVAISLLTGRHFSRAT